jgi:hypothetical protein
MWTLEDALLVIQMLQLDVRQFGYHVALGGGVLNSGASDKDLDLYFLALCDNETPTEPEELIAFLECHFGDATPIRGEGYSEDPHAIYHSKLKFSWTEFEGDADATKYRRIDAFIGR